jgi:hypothetical protein
MLVKRILSNLENTNLFNFPLKEKKPRTVTKGILRALNRKRTDNTLGKSKRETK